MKKKIAIISIGYIWFPCEPGPSRFYYIANKFVEAGYEVDIITSNFQHFRKTYRDLDKIGKQNYPFNIFFVEVPKYKKNIDLRRVYSNVVAKIQILKFLKEKGKNYDAIYCTIPANNIAAGVSEYCISKKIPFIVDIEDLWPEAMSMIFKISVLNKMLFYSFKRDAEIVYKNADAVIGTSNEYTERAFRNRKRSIPYKTVYAGCDLDKYDRSVKKYFPEINKNENEFWVSYAGSIGTSYDISTLVEAATKLERKGYSLIKVIIMGTGPLLEDIRDLITKLHNSNIQLRGYTDYPIMATYLWKSDVVINSFVKGAPQSIVNKIGDYLASKSAIINTLENFEFMSMVTDNKIGINIEPENSKALENAILELYKNKELRIQMGENSRRLAEKQFDVATTYEDIVNMVSNFTL